MTREKQIAVAFDDYSDAIGLSTFGDFEYIDIQGAFEEGAKWADNHPKNVWHDTDDMPKSNSWILIQNDKYEYDTLNIKSEYIRSSWVSTCKVFRYKRWAYISDLLPKGGEK